MPRVDQTKYNMPRVDQTKYRMPRVNRRRKDGMLNAIIDRKDEYSDAWRKTLPNEAKRMTVEGHADMWWAEVNRHETWKQD
jgi:hypothetical protein